MAQSDAPIVSIRDGRLHVGDHVIDSHRVVKEIGRGANGIVYQARNELLARDEAIKVWLRLRAHDTRDKLEQGLRESVKLAAANGNHAVQIYQAKVLSGTVVALMEFVPGETLRDVCQRFTEVEAIRSIAWTYLNLISDATTTGVFHGDPHWKNVLISAMRVSDGFPSLEMKLCDFGTSIFTGPEFSTERHWRVVGDTVLDITKGLPGAQEAERYLREGEQRVRKTLAKDERGVLSDADTVKIRLAPMRDYLELWDRV